MMYNCILCFSARLLLVQFKVHNEGNSSSTIATAAHDDASITLLLSFVSVNFREKKQIFMIIVQLLKALLENFHFN